MILSFPLQLESPVRKRQYDLEERTRKFGVNTRAFVRIFPRRLTTLDDLKQIIRSSGSVGANYIEARECVSMPDRIHRIKICRKEAKESQHWLHLLKADTPKEIETQRENLLQEAKELELIFGAMLQKMKV